MSSRAKSIFAGKPLYDMRGMICSPAMARDMARAKTTGYLSARAKPNRWGIERVDINASECLQSMPCQHNAVLWLVSGDTKRAPTTNAAELYAIARLIGAKFPKAGEQHLAIFLERYESLKGPVAALLDDHFGTANKVTARPPTKRTLDDGGEPIKKKAVSTTEQTPAIAATAEPAGMAELYTIAHLMGFRAQQEPGPGMAARVEELKGPVATKLEEANHRQITKARAEYRTAGIDPGEYAGSDDASE